jgi:hypothetical protein
MKELFKTITDTRMVYLLMSIVLLLSYAFDLWAGVVFVSLMLTIGVWTGFCPSKAFFDWLGFKKTEL